MTQVAEALLADIDSEKTGLRHLPEILVIAEQARDNRRITKREFDEVLREVETKRKELKEAKQAETKPPKQKSLF